MKTVELTNGMVYSSCKIVKKIHEPIMRFLMVWWSAVSWILSWIMHKEWFISTR